MLNKNNYKKENEYLKKQILELESRNKYLEIYYSNIVTINSKFIQDLTEKVCKTCFYINSKEFCKNCVKCNKYCENNKLLQMIDDLKKTNNSLIVDDKIAVIDIFKILKTYNVFSIRVIYLIIQCLEKEYNAYFLDSRCLKYSNEINKTLDFLKELKLELIRDSNK